MQDALCDAALLRNALSAEQRGALAARCTIRHFHAHETLMRQGDVTASMFIILNGAAQVSVHTSSGEDSEVAVLAAGDVVGEMSLMTGAPRTAGVTAMTRMQALEITKDAILPLLEDAPELLQRFSEILAARQQELDAVANRPAVKATEARDLLSRMKAFFGQLHA